MKRLIFILLSALFLITINQTFANPRGKAKVAVIQAERSPRQDPFNASYDFSKVRPMMEAHLDKLLRLLKDAGEMGADIVCAPEDMQNIGAYGLHVDKKDPQTGEILFNSLAVKVPCPLTDRIAAIARRYNMYIVAPVYERDNGKTYNTAVVFDRSGKIIGKHRKTVLPVLETWLVSTGDEYDIFELDFGKIAIATCWEITFPEISTIYALKEADIIFNPTMGLFKPGKSLSTAHRLLTRAVDNSVYVAPVILGSDGNGIIDYDGSVVAEAVGKKNTVIMAEIDLSAVPQSTAGWWPTINGTANNKAMRLLSRRPGTYKQLLEQNPPVLNRFKDVKLTTGNREMQLKAVKEVNYGP